MINDIRNTGYVAGSTGIKKSTVAQKTETGTKMDTSDKVSLSSKKNDVRQMIKQMRLEEAKADTQLKGIIGKFTGQGVGMVLGVGAAIPVLAGTAAASLGIILAGTLGLYAGGKVGEAIGKAIGIKKYNEVKNSNQPSLQQVKSQDTSSPKKAKKFSLFKSNSKEEAREQKERLVAEDLDKYDVNQDFDLIKSKLDKGESLEDATTEFLEIRGKVDKGDVISDYTTREVFSELRMTPPGEQREMEKKQLFKLIDAQTRPADCVRNFTSIKENKADGVSLEEATDQFLEILGKAGSDETRATRMVFYLLNKSEDGKKREAEKAQVFRLMDNEEKAYDAAQDYNYLKQMTPIGSKLEDSVNGFLEIRPKTGGDSNSAIGLFQEMMKFEPGKRRDEAKTLLLKHLDSSSNAEDAWKNFQYVREFTANGESLEKVNKEFFEILGKTGKEESGNARKIFAGLRRVPEGREREAEKKAIFKLIDGENRVSDARDDMKVIKKYRRAGETVKGATDRFLGILNQLGNDDTEKAQRMFIEQRSQ